MVKRKMSETLYDSSKRELEIVYAVKLPNIIREEENSIRSNILELSRLLWG